MSYFVLPAAWIKAALAAAIAVFGAIPGPVNLIYRNLDGENIGEARPPQTIVIDKRGIVRWTRENGECVIVHEYGHLAGYHHDTNVNDPAHSDNPRSIMYPVLLRDTCHSWLIKHKVK